MNTPEAYVCVADARFLSEQQSEVLMTLKDLADGKILHLKNEILKTLKDVRKEEGTALADLSTQLSSLAGASQNQKTLCILNSLDFETRQSRQSDIADTEYRTFEWIFDDKHRPSHQPVGFKKWLQSGDNIYWISGKAGSGKSVLMNYIANDSCTLEMLQSWSGSIKLIIARYFFWNAGAPMQKSQTGLLQSLLREVFGQCPEMVPVICPSRWKRHHDIGATWTRTELSEAFRTLGQQPLVNLKFCFFVDGVDEYDGEDYTHIIRILKDLSASPSVKICLSSRPWNIFSAAFGDKAEQRLLLEDHNKDDIESYIKNRFETDGQFKLLQSRDPRSSELVDQIVQNAQGVFLWVRIVVSNLLRGLNNDDNLMDLHKRLNTFPTTLTAYFQHMFDSIDDHYREETAEILLICLEGIQPLSLLTLWFYEQERITPDYAIQAEISPLGKPDVIAIFARIHKRINARGQDLLVIERDNSKVDHLMFTVRFSHRTVKDFLSKPDMLTELTSWTSEDFDAKVSLCKATIAIVKSLPWSTERVHEVSNDGWWKPSKVKTDRWWRHCSNFFSYAHLMERDKGTLDGALGDELQRAISSIRKVDDQNMRLQRLLTHLAWAFDHWVNLIDEKDRWPVDRASVEELSRYDKDMTNFFFAWSVEANLKGSISYKLQTKPHLMKRPFLRRPILDRALRPLMWSPRTCGLDPDMINLLLTQGANPNEELTVYQSGFVWTTVWALYLHHLYEAKIDKARKPPKVVQDELEATKLLIEHSAAADLGPWTIPGLQKHPPGRTMTPSDVFHEVFPPRDAALLDQILKKHRPWALRRAYSTLRRTVLLWFYREINIVITLIPLLYSMFFNELFGVILPFVMIPTFLYCIVLVWPFVSFVALSTAPVVLSCLILSDWIPIPDALIWCNNLLIWPNSFVSDKSKR